MADCRKKVSCLPVSAFYNSKINSDYIRFSFAKKDDLIIDALEHLKKIFKKYFKILYKKTLQLCFILIIV
jgi:aspartate/methionine/tyrosine aminotransferase